MVSGRLIEFLLFWPLATAALAFATRWFGPALQRAVEIVHLAGVTGTLVTAVFVVASVLGNGSIFTWSNWLFLDALGALFLSLVTIVGFITGLYSIGYLRNDLARKAIEIRDLSTYYGFFHLFLFTMILVITANNLVMMWVAVESTTLASVFLVGFYTHRTALEAAWKYLIICTVGVAFGLYGTVLVFSNADSVLGHAEDAIIWTEVVKHATALDPAILSIAFVFILIGFGTKAGVAPMHAWLPDAYCEAPSPVSALLSGALSNCAFLVIIRYCVIVQHASGALPQKLLIVFGVLSIAVAALFIGQQRDMKRMLAYSSVENMGLIFLGLGIGGPLGIAASLLHVINHGLAKTLMFCCSGNVSITFGTRNLASVKGMLRVAPMSGMLLLAGALALSGMPPFNVFVSEFMTIAAGVKADYMGLMILCLVMLTIVLAAFVRMIGGSILGPPVADMKRGDTGWMTLLPSALVLALMLVMGVHIPDPAARLIAEASDILRVDKPQTRETASQDVQHALTVAAEADDQTQEIRVTACGRSKTELEASCPK